MTGPIRGFRPAAAAAPTPRQLYDMLEGFWAWQLPKQRDIVHHAKVLAIVHEGEIARRDRQIEDLRNQLAAALAAAPGVPHPQGNLE